MHLLRPNDAAITALRPWSDSSFWSSNSTGSVCLWSLEASASEQQQPGIVAQFTGVDCEPVHDMCFTTSQAFVASYGAVRVYALAGGMWNDNDQPDWYGLRLPKRKEAKVTSAPAPMVQ